METEQFVCKWHTPHHPFVALLVLLHVEFRALCITQVHCGMMHCLVRCMLAIKCH